MGMTIVSLALLFAASAAPAEPPAAPPAAATASPDQRDLAVLSDFLAALLTRDEARILALAEPDIRVDPSIDNRPGLRDTTLAQLLERTRSCDIGAILQGYSREPGYTVNWWCDYAEGDTLRFPTSGAHVVVGVAGGRLRLTNFSYGIRYGAPARQAVDKGRPQ